MRGQGLPESEFNYYINQYLATDKVSWTDSALLVKHINILQKDKIEKNDKKFLYALFAKTHKVFLRRYDAHAPFQALLQDGQYNCLTGTALYALLLNRFGYSYQIIETNYHIFLLVESASGDILFEATDPSGFVSDQKTIKSRIAHYRANRLNADDSHQKSLYTFQYSIYRSVDLNQLTGLLLYNKAVEAFNHDNLKQCVWYLDETEKYYTSERITEFSSLIAYVLADSKSNGHSKDGQVKEMKRHPRNQTNF